MKGTESRKSGGNEMYNLESIKFWMNFIGLALNGAGTFLLAYIVFSSNKWSKKDRDVAKNKHDVTCIALVESKAHDIETSDKNKWAMFLIFVGVLLQMSAMLI
jgi:hypothetical protein